MSGRPGPETRTWVVSHLDAEFPEKAREDVSASKRIKRTLPSTAQAARESYSLLEGVGLHTSISRARLEELSDLFRSTLEPMEQALWEARPDKAQIQDPILAGGSTRIPKVQKLLRQFFNCQGLNKSTNPSEALAYMAAAECGPPALGVGDSRWGDDHADPPSPPSKPRPSPPTLTTSLGVLIRVCEGERAMTSNSNLLGAP